ncbi:MAG: phage holin family protein [Proteobacteria bacterium]|nr:phage holin family protein [Pseudomonadota bacterium]
MEQTPQEPAQERTSLIAGISALVRNALGLSLCRLELAALELAEVRAALLKLALVFAIGVVTAWFALAGWSALLVVLTWDSLGWKIIAILAALFTLAATAAIWYVRAMLAQGKLSLPSTMEELRNDRLSLTQPEDA